MEPGHRQRRMRLEQAGWGLPSLVLLSLLAPAVEGQSEALSSAPGTVVRWIAPETETCEAEGRSWLPHGETCYFPVDLQRTKPLEISRIRAGERERAVVDMAEYPYPVQHVTVEGSYVDLSPEDIERSRVESGRIGALWSLETSRQFDLPLSSPLASVPEARNFGSRRVFNGQPRRPHSGADFSAGVGTEVLATANGTVALAEDHFFGGKSVFLDHGDGLVSMYMHLSSIAVVADTTVERGQVIGKVGATGRVSGPHLHFGFRWRGARIDPEVLLAP